MAVHYFLSKILKIITAHQTRLISGTCFISPNQGTSGIFQIAEHAGISASHIPSAPNQVCSHPILCMAYISQADSTMLI
jgi:hypothetical protein